MQQANSPFKNSMQKISRAPLTRIFAGIVAAVLIFVLGVGVGQGSISVGTVGLKSENGNLPNQLDYSSVNDLYKVLKKDYNGTLTQEQLQDGLKHGLAEATNDPYTEYFTAKEAQQFTSQLQGTITGIGAQLDQDENKNLIIVAPIAGSPAEKAGLKPKDYITQIDGKDTSGMKIDDAVNRIRGKKGTKVTLQILRGGSQLLSFTITRDDIQIPSVTSKTLDNNIGYISISQFSDNTGDLALQAAQKLKDTGVKGIVLDLRDNPGGEVQAAVEVASLWLPQDATIMQEKRASGQVIDTLAATGQNPLKGMPTVVLINGNSASASEITAGALKDNNAATLIGEKSYGKGVMQQIDCIGQPARSDGSCPGAELKVTIASWYRPNGQNINKKGITPDKTVTLSADDITNGNDTQLTAAEAQLNQ